MCSEQSIRHFLVAFAAASASFLSVSLQHVGAQAAGQVDSTSERSLQEPDPSTEPAPEEPSLQLKLDDAGVEVAPTPPRTVDGYTMDGSHQECRPPARLLQASLG
jgi:hypothetical protein